MFGCDTTYSFYSHLLVQTLVPGKWASLRREIDVFKDPGSTHEQIHEAGLKIVAARYSTDQNCVSEKLNEAREIQFHKKCSSKSAKRGVNLASLDSVYLHLDEAYFQIQECDGSLHFGAFIYVLTPFLSEVRNFSTLEMGVAQKTTFSTPENLKKFFGVSGDVMEYNERGKPLKGLSSLTNPKSAGLMIKLSQAGNSQRKRVKDLSISHTIIQSTIKKFQNTGFV